MPNRIQRKRTRGWRMPEGAVYVGRPSKWGNPFRWEYMGRELAVRMFEEGIILGDLDQIAAMARAELAGRDLACWCPLDQPCHADALLEIANSTSDSGREGTAT